MRKSSDFDLGPPVLYTAALIMASFAFLAILNIASLVGILDNNSQTTSGFINDASAMAVRHGTDFLDKIPFVEAIVAFLFWLLVGAAIYGLILVVIDVVYTIRRQKSLIFDYTYPVNTKRSTIIRHIFFHWIIVLVVGLVLLFSLGILVIFTLPISKGVFMNGFNNSDNLSAWAYTAEAGLLLAVNTQAVIWTTRTFWRGHRLLQEA